MRRKLFSLILIVLISIIFVFPISAGEIIYTVSPQSINYGHENGYTTLNINGYKNILSPGEPALPYKVINVLIPPTAVVKDVKIDNIRHSSSSISGKVFPAQKPVPIMDKNIHPFTEPNLDIYNNSNRFPDNLIVNIGTVNKSNFRIAQIAVYPVQYLPTENKINTYSFTIHILYSEGKVALKTMNENQYKSFGNKIKSLVINPEILGTYQSCIRR